MKYEEKRLGEIATFVNGFAFKPKDWGNTGLPIIRIQNLTNTNNQFNYYDGKYQEKYEVNNGDILISWSASLGVYEWYGNKALLNQHIFKVVFNKGDINSRYFKYVAGKAINEMNKYIHGSTMKHIVKSDFDNIKIPLPPLEIQQKIADVLDKAQELIDKRKKQIELLDDFLQSVFIEMFGDPVKNPKGWEIVTVSEICNCIVPGRDKPKSFSGTIPWITINDLEKNSYTVKSKSNLGLNYAEIKDVNAKIIPKGSVIMSCVGELGITSIAGTDLVMNQQLHSFQCSEIINNQFLKMVLPYQKHYMRKMWGFPDKTDTPELGFLPFS